MGSGKSENDGTVGQAVLDFTTVFSGICLFLSVMSAVETSAHLPALEEFKSSHPFLADDVDKLPDVRFADRAQSTVRKHAGAFQ